MVGMMGNRDKICPECGKEFHACSSCYFTYDYEYNYCSLECYKKSLTYDEKKRTLIRLIGDALRDISNLEELASYIDDDLDDEAQILLHDEEVKQAWEEGWKRYTE